MEAAVALNVPCSTLLPCGLATACLQAIGVVGASCDVAGAAAGDAPVVVTAAGVVVVVIADVVVVVAAATFIAINDAGDDVDEDDDEDFVESVRDVDSFCRSDW